MNAGRGAGISGSIDLAGFTAPFQATIYGFQKSLTAQMKPRRGRDVEGQAITDGWQNFRRIFSSGNLEVNGRVTTQAVGPRLGSPYPTDWTGQVGNVTLQADVGKFATVPVRITSGGISYGQTKDDWWRINFTCTLLGPPVWTGFGTAPDPATETPFDQQQWDGTILTVDPDGIVTMAERVIDIWGSLANTDAAEADRLSASISATLPPLENLQLYTSSLSRDSIDGGSIHEMWKFTTSADDLLNPHMTSQVDPDDIDNSGQTSAMNTEPADPDIPNTLLARTNTIKINDQNTMYVAERAKWTPRQAIDLGETALTVDAFELETAGTWTKTFPTTGSLPTITFSGGGGTGAAAVAVADAGGTIVGIAMINNGTGYSFPPTASASGGSGSGLVLGAVAIDAITHKVSSVAITSGGNGYGGNLTPPPWLPQLLIADGTGTGAAAYCVVDSAGVVVGIQIVAGGQNYDSPYIAAVGGYGSSFAPGAATVVDGVITAIAIATAGTGYIDNIHPDLQIVNCRVEDISAFHAKGIFQLGLRTSQQEIEWGGTIVDSDAAAFALDSEATITQVELTADSPSIPDPALPELKNVGYTEQQHTLSKAIRKYSQRELDSNDQRLFPETNITYSPHALKATQIPFIDSLVNGTMAPSDTLTLNEYADAIFAVNQGDATFDGLYMLRPIGNNSVIVGIRRNYQDKTVGWNLNTNYEIVKSNGSFVRVAMGFQNNSSSYSALVMPQGCYRTRGEFYVTRRFISTLEPFEFALMGYFGYVGAIDSSFLGFDSSTEFPIDCFMYGGSTLVEEECESLAEGGRLIVIRHTIKFDSLAFQDDASVTTGMFVLTETDVTTPGDYESSNFNWTINYPGKFTDLTALVLS